MHVTPYNADVMTIPKYNEPYTGPSDWRSATGSVDMTRIDLTLLRLGVQLVVMGNNVKNRNSQTIEFIQVHGVTTGRHEALHALNHIRSSAF